MGQILLVRHAQASFGAEDYDVLSSLGHEQSTILGRRLRELESIDRVVHGAMVRQRHTAELVVAEIDEPPALHADARWDEYDHEAMLACAFPTQADKDAFAEGMAAADNPRRFFQDHFERALQRWIAGAHDADYSESFTAFAERVQQALSDVLGDADGTVVVVTSGGVISAICAELLGLSAQHWARLNRVIVNTGITKLVQGRSGLNLITVNDHAHLENGAPRLITYR
jgi:broad specificity phosphatase PhoE